MKILVDADACPVVAIVEEIGEKYSVPVILLCDTSHYLCSPYSEVVVISSGSNAVDTALFNRCAAGDIVVTQDYGVAAMVLGKKAFCIHPNGKRYNDRNIESLLNKRYQARKARIAGGRLFVKGPPKRTPEDDERFRSSFEELVRFASEKERAR